MKIRFPVFVTAVSVLTLTVAWGGAVPASGAPGPPNVIFIMFDDLGYQDLGVYGNTFTETPTIDAFAAQGIRLTQYYVQSTCSPTRASILTGRHPQRFNIRRPLPLRAFRGLHDTYPTLPQVLKQTGYVTGQFGKWHLGMIKEEFFPAQRGFDEHVTLWGSSRYDGARVLTQERGFWSPLVEDSGPGLETTNGLTPEVFTSSAIRFIERHRDRPFFIYLTYRAPHLPVDDPDNGTAPQRLIDRYAAKCRTQGNPAGCQSSSRYVAAMITFLDEQIERLLATLSLHGLAQNTVVFITSDNGAPARRHLGSNGSLKGEKDSLFEGGIRVPMIVRWPGRIPAGETSPALATVLDVFPTITGVAGIDTSAIELAGRSFVPALLDPEHRPEETPRFWEMKPKRFTRINADTTNDYAVRLGDWKLYVGSRLRDEGGRLVLDRSVSEDHLFNIAADPTEDVNRAAQNPLMVAKLKTLYSQWRRDVNTIECPVTESSGGAVRVDRQFALRSPGRFALSCPESDFHDGNFTFSARIRLGAPLADDAVVAYKGSEENPSWLLRLAASGHVELEARSQPLAGEEIEVVRLRSASALAVDRERRITFTVQGWLTSASAIRLFIDSEIEAENEEIEGVLSSPLPVFLGSLGASHREPFVGTIRDVHLSTARWTIDEVRDVVGN